MRSCQRRHPGARYANWRRQVAVWRNKLRSGSEFAAGRAFGELVSAYINLRTYKERQSLVFRRLEHSAYFSIGERAPARGEHRHAMGGRQSASRTSEFDGTEHPSGELPV